MHKQLKQNTHFAGEWVQRLDRFSSEPRPSFFKDHSYFRRRSGSGTFADRADHDLFDGGLSSQQRLKTIHISFVGLGAEPLQIVQIMIFLI